MNNEELSKLVQKIDRMLEVQRNSIDDEYMHGMYNGMEFIRSMVTRSQPIYINADKTFDKADIDNNPERFI